MLGRVLVEHVQEIVVAHLEHLGARVHAERVALASIEPDDHAHQLACLHTRTAIRRVDELG